ncbi:ankyrin repeat-containing domain protein [Coprinopsis sp. MPI-PUGE-AT-0042]|nr:ankyrin repeat-containing domain protein [Coprinopsis sp. MPI-PUGE-AT-0042]
MANHGDEPRTELSRASFEGNVAAVTRLLDSGVDYLEADASGRKALHWAVAQGHFQVVEKLLAHHQRETSSSPMKPVQVHTLTYSELQFVSLRIHPVVTPIELAAKVDDEAIFKLLLENLEPFTDTTVLLNGIWPPVSHRREGIPDSVDHRNLSDYHLAQNTSLPSRQAYENEGDWQKELLSFVLHLSIKDDKYVVADMALRLGADPGVGYGPTHVLPLHVAAWCCRDPAYVQLLLKHGANLEAKGRQNKETPLSIAVGAYNEKVVTALLNAGASPNPSIQGYSSLLSKACSLYSCGSWRAIEIPYVLPTIRALLEAGADINTHPGLMYYAAGAEGGAAIFKELVAWGGNLTAATSDGLCVARNLARRSSWGTEQEYQAILDIFRTAYNSLPDLRAALLVPDSDGEIRYSVLLEFGFHADEPMDRETFRSVVRGRIRDLVPGLLEVLAESAHVVPELTTSDLHFCMNALFDDHFRDQTSLTTEMAEDIVTILRILDQVGAIEPAMATTMLFDIVKQYREFGGEIQCVVEALLDLGASVARIPARNELGPYYDIFALAAIFGHERIISCLLRRFGHQNDGEETSHLALPCWLQKGDINSACLIHGNNINAVLHCLESTDILFKGSWDVFEDPLPVAVKRGDLEAVQKLISLGAYVNDWDGPYDDGSKPDKGGAVSWTVLHSAVVTGHGPIVEILLQANAAVNVISFTHPDWFSHFPYPSEMYPLHGATIHGDTAIIERLLAYGADVNATTRDTRETPLDFALSSRYLARGCRHQKVDGPRVAAAALLVKRGASVSGLAAKLGKKQGISGLLEVFSNNPGLWDTIVAGQ